MWIIFIVVVIQAHKNYTIFWGNLWLNGIKKTTILSDFLPVSVLLYIYCWFTGTYYLGYLITWWDIMYFIGVIYTVFISQSGERIPIICMKTYFIPLIWCNEVSLNIVNKWNPITIIVFIIKELNPNLYKKYSLFARILGWIACLPELTCRLLCFYFLILKVSFPLLISYYLLKIFGLLWNKKLTHKRLWNFLKQQIMFYIGAIVIFILITYLTFCFYQEWLIPWSVRLSLSIWWIGRLIFTLRKINYSHHEVQYIVQDLSGDLVENLDGCCFGLQYFIIPYANVIHIDTARSFPLLKHSEKVLLRREFRNTYRLDEKYHLWSKSIIKPNLKYKFSSKPYYRRGNIVILNYQVHNTVNLTGQNKPQWLNNHIAGTWANATIAPPN